MQNPQLFSAPGWPQHEQATAPAAATHGPEHADHHHGSLPDVSGADDRPLDAAATAFTPGHHLPGHLSYIMRFGKTFGIFHLLNRFTPRVTVLEESLDLEKFARINMMM
jgi:hypothetical protein